MCVDCVCVCWCGGGGGGGAGKGVGWGGEKAVLTTAFSLNDKLTLQCYLVSLCGTG